MKSRSRTKSWNWAARNSIEITDSVGGGGSVSNAATLLPAARVDWLLENGRGRDHLTTSTILLWLDMTIYNPSLEPGSTSYMDFWLMKTKTDASGATQTIYSPYQEPVVPASLSTWDTPGVEESDGLDPYLWTHRLSPTVAGMIGANYITSGVPAGGMNTSNKVLNGGYVQPLTSVRAAWQPDVVIRTSRRLYKGEELTLGFNIVSQGTGLVYHLEWAARMLTS